MAYKLDIPYRKTDTDDVYPNLRNYLQPGYDVNTGIIDSKGNGVVTNSVIPNSTQNTGTIISSPTDKNNTSGASSGNTSSEDATPTDPLGAYLEHYATKPGEYNAENSSVVMDAQAALNKHLATKPGEYVSLWSQQMGDAMNAYLNRPGFSYDFNSDALYQQYKDQYIKQGKLAMADVMGQAAAMTGGYGNSYAATVGNQAYQASLDNLNDIIPDLYSMAYDKYNQEGQDLLNAYSLYADRDADDYAKYLDEYNAWESERSYLKGVYDEAKTEDYSKYLESVDDWNTTLKELGDTYNESIENAENENPFGMYTQEDFVKRMWETITMNDPAAAAMLVNSAKDSGGDEAMIEAIFATFWEENWPGPAFGLMPQG